MSGILNEEMVEKLRSTLESGLGGYEDFITGENACAALEAVLPMLGEAIAKAVSDNLTAHSCCCQEISAELIRRLTASLEK